MFEIIMQKLFIIYGQNKTFNYIGEIKVWIK